MALEGGSGGGAGHVSINARRREGHKETSKEVEEREGG